MEVRFSKMHGIGNDFIVVDRIRNDVHIDSSTAVKMCDRRFGIGADQIILIGNSKKADFKMGILNADGSEVEMCGNGIRCAAKYILDNHLSDNTALSIETLAGIMYPEIIGDKVKVNMGCPKLLPADIPVGFNADRVVNVPVVFGGSQYYITAVSMGNPHCVIFVDTFDGLELERIGYIIEHADIFPKRTNVEFVKVLSADHISVRVWERGSGATLACGTGACACVVASALNGKTDRCVRVSLPGGDLDIYWADDGFVFMTGPAEKVFDGIINI